MNCLEFRRLNLIEPQDSGQIGAEHQLTCHACAKFKAHLLHQNQLIREAAFIEVPEGFAARIMLNQSLHSESRRPTRWQWLSLAATFLLAAVLIPATIGTRSIDPMAKQLFAHIEQHNPRVNHDLNVSAIREPVDRLKVEQVLASVDTAMPDFLDNVVYAATCVIDGELMAHLVVEDNNTQYVVFVIPQSTLINRPFSDSGWHGQLASLNRRSIAVMSTGDDTNVSRATDAFVRQFNKSISSGQTI